MEVVLNDANFSEEVLKSKKPVLVDFWAPWCGPCKVIGPIIEELAKEYDGKVKIGKMNVDASSGVPSEYGVLSIPTLLFFREGVVVDQVVGAVPKSVLVERIEKLMS